MIWIGDRTRQPDGAHVEFARGVQNPIGLKCGPSITESDLLKLIDRLNPKNEAGRLTLIARFGAGAGRRAPAAADPGGRARGAQASSGPATRCTATPSSRPRATRPGRSSGCCARCASSSRSTRAEGTIPGGVHFEMTGKDVTECTGGVRAVTDENLSDRYHTACDPRLNAAQALELAFLVAEMLHQRLQARRAAV